MVRPFRKSLILQYRHGQRQKHLHHSLNLRISLRTRMILYVPGLRSAESLVSSSINYFTMGYPFRAPSCIFLYGPTHLWSGQAGITKKIWLTGFLHCRIQSIRPHSTQAFRALDLRSLVQRHHSRLWLHNLLYVPKAPWLGSAARVIREDWPSLCSAGSDSICGWTRLLHPT